MKGQSRYTWDWLESQYQNYLLDPKSLFILGESGIQALNNYIILKELE